ncbi:hypothetical protein [Tenacibaculum xiamenense]|uniref:hypothetical protein n=1 Tax=Tenacibaculum xiamenense TaxID=1261553 RepID=UPI0038954C12
MDNTTIKGETVESKSITMKLNTYSKLNEKIKASKVADGPSVNISQPENIENKNSYKVTVLTYLPDAVLSKVENNEGLELDKEFVYLNYVGINPVQFMGKDGKYTTLQGREFRFDYNCEVEKDKIKEYFLCYLQFSYTINDNQYADVIWVRDENEDPETDRGTVTGPSDLPPPTTL